METLAARPREKLKSFDVLANVEALRFDIENHGYILDATLEQVGNEQLSYLVEGIDKAARPSFVLKRKGHDLVYFDSGHLRPYSQMLEAGLEANRYDAMIDPRRQFLVDWALNDYYHYSQFRKLKPGEQYVWTSPYPHDIEARYGRDFLMECGLRPDRQMGFIYRALCQEDGSVLLETQTVDHSDDAVLHEVIKASHEVPDIDLGVLTHIYDSHLGAKHNAEFYAGRLNTERDEDAWLQIWQNQDLINYLLDGFEDLAWKSHVGYDVEQATKRHIYGVWALFKKRLDGSSNDHKLLGSDDLLQPIAAQVQDAFSEFASAGHILVGCGGSVTIKNEKDIFNSSIEDVFSSIFGVDFKSSGSDKYGSLKFKCTKGHDNVRKKGELLKKCQHKGCTGKVAC